MANNITFKEFIEGNYISNTKEYQLELYRYQIHHFRLALRSSTIISFKDIYKPLKSICYYTGNPTMFISGAFSWAWTLKGQEYWSNICDKLAKKYF